MSVVDTSASTSAMAVPTLTSQILAGRRATIASRRPVNARPTRLTSTRGPAALGRPLDARDRLPQARPINPEPAAALAAATSRDLPSPPPTTNNAASISATPPRNATGGRHDPRAPANPAPVKPVRMALRPRYCPNGTSPGTYVQSR